MMSCMELHLFSDASHTAYGACAYIVEPTKRGSLILSKAKVAPMKKVTIPKLELTAIVLAARMSKFVQEAYKGIVTFKEIYWWCDSQVALHWLQSEKVLPAYVSNRVEEIKESIPIHRIRYVTSKDIPADLVTRGIDTKVLKRASEWWHGPSWLPHKEKWPKDAMKEIELGQPESVMVTLGIPQPERIINWERYGSYDKGLRVLAWVLRFNL